MWGQGRGKETDLAALLLPKDSRWWVALALALESHALARGDSLVMGPGDKLGGHCSSVGRDKCLCGHSTSTQGCSPGPFLPCTVRVPDASDLPTLLSATQV